MVYCLFRHAAAHTVRGLVVRAGERVLIEKPGHAAAAVLRRIAPPVAGASPAAACPRGSRSWGAVGVAGYAYYDNMRVAETTIELFRSDFIDI